MGDFWGHNELGETLQEFTGQGPRILKYPTMHRTSFVAQRTVLPNMLIVSLVAHF